MNSNVPVTVRNNDTNQLRFQMITTTVGDKRKKEEERSCSCSCLTTLCDRIENFFLQMFVPAADDNTNK